MKGRGICKFCSKWFNSHLVRHIRSHTGERPYKCKFCDYSATRNYYLTKHEEVQHKNIKDKSEGVFRHEDTSENKVGLSGIKNKEASNLNQSSLSTEAAFGQRKAEEAQEPRVKITRESKKPRNSKDDVSYTTGSRSNDSSRAVSKMEDKGIGARATAHSSPLPVKVNCKESPKHYASTDNLKRPLKNNTDKKNYQCGWCKKCFRTNMELAQHERVHTGERPFACKYCEKNFTQPGSLLNHTRLHMRLKPFKCKFCDYSSAQRKNLVSHERRHKGESPYLKRCSRKFSQSGSKKPARSHPNKSIHQGALTQCSGSHPQEAKSDLEKNQSPEEEGQVVGRPAEEKPYTFPTPSKPEKDREGVQDLNYLVGPDQMQDVHWNACTGNATITESRLATVVEKCNNQSAFKEQKKTDHNCFELDNVYISAIRYRWGNEILRINVNLNEHELKAQRHSYRICHICKFVTMSESKLISHLKSMHS